jgi:hypothetical protein
MRYVYQFKEQGQHLVFQSGLGTKTDSRQLSSKLLGLNQGRNVCTVSTKTHGIWSLKFPCSASALSLCVFGPGIQFVCLRSKPTLVRAEGTRTKYQVFRMCVDHPENVRREHVAPWIRVSEGLSS